VIRPALPVVLCLGLAVGPALGQGGGAGSSDLARVEAERRTREAERDALRTQAHEAARERERLQGRLAELLRDQVNEEAGVSGQRARLEALNRREAALVERMGRNRVKLARLLGALQLYSRNPPPPLMVSPRSATDAVRAAILMRAVTPELERRGRAFAVEAEQVAEVRRQAALAGETLFLSESELADRRAEIERLLGEKAELQSQLSADADAADRAAQSLAAREQALRGFVAGLANRPRAAAPPAGAFLGGRTVLRAPAAGQVVRRFGRGSEGWTWRTERNALVTSPVDGVVEYAGPLKGWDLVVVVRTDVSGHVVLAGLGSAVTAAGRSVAAGDPLGRAADRREPKPEIYMEIRRDGSPVDPARWLDARAGG
jgi:septal ring factor EnvC (AmiA/AmiB activator)